MRATKATGRGSHTMHDDDYVKKLRYTKLLEIVTRDRGKNLDLGVHRFQAVAKGKCIGYFSTLNMAFGEVDGAIGGRLVLGPWTEVKVASDVNYVEDLVAKRTYVRMSTKATDDGYGTNLHSGRAPAPRLEKSAEIPVGVDVEEEIWKDSDYANYEPGE